MFKTYRTIIYAVLITLLALAACAPSSPQVPTPDANTVLTQAAGTVAVQMTEDAAKRPTEPPTHTPEPTNTLAPATPTSEPTAPVAAATNPPAPTQAPVQNTQDDAASFVTDVSIPDGTSIAPGQAFDKTWRLKNTGKTTWTPAYSLIYIQGEQMNAPASIPMPKDVPPGESVDITVRLTAPAQNGTYQTFFRLRNDKGQSILLDGSGDPWVKITVGPANQATATPTSSGASAPTAEAPTNTPEPTAEETATS